MYYTYIIRSISQPSKIYIGYSSNLRARLEDHNLGKSVYTKNDRPWKLEFYSAFTDKNKALSFEKYLKSGSGKAFTKKHF